MGFKDNFKKVNKGTIIRTIALVIAIANQVVAVIGRTSFASATWYQILSVAVTGVTAVWTAWENNDRTFFARLGTGVLDALEDGKVTKDEVLDLIEKQSQEKDDTQK